MNCKGRLKAALNHIEHYRVPYYLTGITVTGINKKAFIRAMNYRDLSAAIDKMEIDPIQQIVTPVEETLKKLNSDIRRIGSQLYVPVGNSLITDAAIIPITGKR